MNIGDIDIDVQSSFKPEKLFPWTKASMLQDKKLLQHPCGVHPQNIPVDPITKLSAIPYELTEDLEYAKIDFLHVYIYDVIKSREELKTFTETEPNWNLLLDTEVQLKLFQLSKHGDLLDLVKPKNLCDLADVLALIRPGKMKYKNLYVTNKEEIRRVLFTSEDGSYVFKKAHAFSYALLIQVQLHLIEQGRL